MNRRCFFSGRGGQYSAASSQRRGESVTQKSGLSYRVNPGSSGLTRSVEMLGRAGRGGSVAVAAVHRRVDGALAGGPVHHPVPSVLVPLETVRESVGTKRALGPRSRSSNVESHESYPGAHGYTPGPWSLNIMQTSIRGSCLLFKTCRTCIYPNSDR